MYIGGLDIGTTGCKLTLFDETGSQLAKSYCDYPVSRKVGTHEVDAKAILEGVYTVISDITKDYPDIKGIGVTSFGETFVAVDEEGMPLRNSMLYTDPRGDKQCVTLCEKLSAEHIADIAGVEPHEMYSLPKVMWLKENEPEIYEKAVHIFLMEDFVIYHLTGEKKIDYSLATRTMAFDIRKLQWSQEIFDAAGIDSSLFSEAVPTGTKAGTVSEKAAEKTGLRKDTIVVCISHDQIAAAVGAGVFTSDTAVDGAGTVQCITPIFDEIPDMRIMTKGKYAVVPYAIPGKYVCYAFSYTGGALMQWCTDTLAKKEKELAKEQNISVNEYLEKEYEEQHGENPSGLLVLPHFSGAATPYMA
ncbi:MAG: carbohydrate kinase, partial [Clostridia bacterium]|nr:carbohydrate kinase [Clostridia bacterium]